MSLYFYYRNSFRVSDNPTHIQCIMSSASVYEGVSQSLDAVKPLTHCLLRAVIRIFTYFYKYLYEHDRAASVTHS